MRVIIAGSRSITDATAVEEAILASGFHITTVVSGTAAGVDRLGEAWARRNFVLAELYPADWDSFGKRAGFVRNQRMAENAEALIAIWDGRSRGTKDMIARAVKNGLRVYIHRV